MILNENMKGFNSRNPFVIRCSNAIFDLDEDLVQTTKLGVRITIILVITAIFCLIGTAIYGTEVMFNTDTIHAVIAVLGLLINVGGLLIFVLHMVGIWLYYTSVLKSTVRKTAMDLLESVKDETLLVNNEKVLNATGLIHQFSGLVDGFLDLFNFEYRKAIIMMSLSIVSIVVSKMAF